MAFTLSGTTITQAGTDTDLSGLNGITGVTTLTAGSGDRLFTVYDIGNIKLEINGTLSIDAENEQLLIGSSAPRSCVKVAGTLNINDTQTLNQFVRRQQRVAIKTTYNRAYFGADYSLEVTTGGSLIMRGGAIEVASSIYFHADSNIDIEDGRIELTAAPSASYQMRQYSNNLKATNFSLVKFSMTMIGIPVKLDGYKPTQCFEGLGFSGDSADTEYIVRDYAGSGNGNIMDFALWDSKKVKLINSVNGSNVVVNNHVNGNAGSKGTVQVTKEITVNVTDETGIVENAAVFIRDKNNGNRKDGNGYTFSTDKTYFKVTSPAGSTETTEVLLGVVNEPVYDATPDFDYRGINNDNSDIFNISVVSYLHNSSTIQTGLKGSGVSSIPAPLTKDVHITQTDSTVVAAYVVISTIERLYDYLKYLKTFETNIELPSIDKLFVTADGSTITINSTYTLVRDQALTGAPVQIVGTQIKVKTGVNGLLKTDKFNILLGNVDSTFDGNTNMQYAKINGRVSVGIELSSEAGTNNPVFGLWPKSQGVTNRAGILTAPATGLIDVTPNTVMYFVADAVNAYRSEPVEFTVGAFGQVLTSSIRRIKKVDGTNLLPDALLVAQQRIADMMNYNQVAARVDITLPSNYATDERWDSTTNTWTFKTEDFWALAYKAEQLQSSEGSLIDPSVVIIDNYELSLTSYSSLTFRQDVNNINCTINMNAFIIKRQGDTEQANTFVDHSNGVILVNAGSLIIADVTAPPSILSGVTNDLKIVNNNIKDILKLDPTGSGFQDIP